MNKSLRLRTVNEQVHNPLVRQYAAEIAQCALYGTTLDSLGHLVVLLAREIERLQALLDQRKKGDEALSDLFLKTR